MVEVMERVVVIQGDCRAPEGLNVTEGLIMDRTVVDPVLASLRYPLIATPIGVMMAHIDQNDVYHSLMSLPYTARSVLERQWKLGQLDLWERRAMTLDVLYRHRTTPLDADAMTVIQSHLDDLALR